MIIAGLDLVTLALWAFAALAAAAVCLPMILAILGFTRVQITPTGGPDAAEPKGDDPQYAAVFERLRELGFESLGGRVEKGWLYLWYWLRTALPGCILATPNRDCFVSLYRLYRGDPWRVCFSTVLTDGTLVATANQLERLRIDRPGYYRRGYFLQDLAELLRIHHDAVEGFRAAGYTVDTPDLAGYCRVSAERTEEYLRESGKGQAFKCLQTALLPLCFLPLTAGFILGFDHWMVPTAVVVGAVLFELLMPTTIRTGSERIRREEEQKALAHDWARARRMRAVERSALGPADPEEGVFPTEQRHALPETIQTDPPPGPPTDITRPPRT